ncbi:MAG: hypothetical protein WKI04_15795 [Ferruginibacter sp.]
MLLKISINVDEFLNSNSADTSLGGILILTKILLQKEFNTSRENPHMESFAKRFNITGLPK